MAKKEFHYRGYTLEQLRNMSPEEISNVYPSRARRSMKRGFTDSKKKFLDRIRKNRAMVDSGGTQDVIETHNRDLPILPEMVGLTIGIYNGKEYVSVEIKPDMLGQFLGEFALTRKPVKHGSPGIGATRSSLFVPVK